MEYSYNADVSFSTIVKGGEQSNLDRAPKTFIVNELLVYQNMVARPQQLEAFLRGESILLPGKLVFNKNPNKNILYERDMASEKANS